MKYDSCINSVCVTCCVLFSIMCIYSFLLDFSKLETIEDLAGLEVTNTYIANGYHQVISRDSRGYETLLWTKGDSEFEEIQ